MDEFIPVVFAMAQVKRLGFYMYFSGCDKFERFYDCANHFSLPGGYFCRHCRLRLDYEIKPSVV